MRGWGALLVVWLLAAGPLGAEASVDRRPRQSIDRGRALARAHCARCHAVEASGLSPNPLAPLFRDLHLAFPVADVLDAVAEGARIGHQGMPRFRFNLHERQDLIAYVHSIQSPGSRRDKEGQPNRDVSP